jgi:hypothetical protein
MIKTNPNYWECDCYANYIHPVSKLKCWLCDAEAADHPDARQDEIDELKKEGNHEDHQA